MTEKPSQGTRGYFLYSPLSKNYFFRVYHDNGDFTDHDIHCEEIEVELLSDWLSFYEKDDNTKTLDWSSKALGRDN